MERDEDDEDLKNDLEKVSGQQKDVDYRLDIIARYKEANKELQEKVTELDTVVKSTVKQINDQVKARYDKKHDDPKPEKPAEI